MDQFVTVRTTIEGETLVREPWCLSGLYTDEARAVLSNTHVEVEMPAKAPPAASLSHASPLTMETTMPQTLEQRRDARLAVRDTERKQDAELDMPLLEAAMEAITIDLAAARAKVAAAVEKLIVTHPMLAGQVQTLGTLETNLVNIVGVLRAEAEALLAPAETQPTNEGA